MSINKSDPKAPKAPLPAGKPGRPKKKGDEAGMHNESTLDLGGDR